MVLITTIEGLTSTQIRYLTQLSRTKIWILAENLDQNLHRIVGHAALLDTLSCEVRRRERLREQARDCREPLRPALLPDSLIKDFPVVGISQKDSIPMAIPGSDKTSTPLVPISIPCTSRHQSSPGGEAGKEMHGISSGGLKQDNEDEATSSQQLTFHYTHRSSLARDIQKDDGYHTATPGTTSTVTEISDDGEVKE